MQQKIRKESCSNRHIDDKVLYLAFINTFNAMIDNKCYFMHKWKKRLDSDKVLVGYKANQFIKILEKADPLEDFDMDLYFKSTEKMSVFEEDKIVVILLDGTAIECEIK